MASAICERQELPVQRKRIVFIEHFSLSAIELPKSARDVIFGPFLFGRGEECSPFAVLNQLPLQEERRVISGARGLLHGMRYEDNSVLLLKFLQRGFHFARGNRVQPRG